MAVLYSDDCLNFGMEKYIGVFSCKVANSSGSLRTVALK